MDLIHFEKVRDGKYLKNYELTYLNKTGKKKTYEMVSRKEIRDTSEIGKSVNGVSIVVTMDDKLLLLKEFRMSINKTIYNLCAGMLEEGETIEECVARELYEETGYELDSIVDILPSSFASVGISDVKTHIVFAKVKGNIYSQKQNHTSPNEEIKAGFYTKEQVCKMLKTEEFSSRSQLIAYFFSKDMRKFQEEINK